MSASIQRRLVGFLMCSAILLSYLPGSFGQPQGLHAAISADPDEEIVYVDAGGVIRVLDTRVSGSNPEVKWVSPVGGWRDFALGDVNLDGDQEIIAIGGGSADGVVAIYDPVIASGPIKPDQKINGIPWDLLFVYYPPGQPVLVETGNFDSNVAGNAPNEIIFFYEIRPGDKESPDDRLRMVVLKANSQTPDGRGWLEHLSQKYEENWEFVTIGNVDGSGTDEFGVVSEDDSNLQVFRVDNGLRRIHEYGSDSRPPKAISIGQWEDGGREEFVFIRDKAAPDLDSMFVQKWEGDNDFTDIAKDKFEPAPRYSFFTNINDNDDEELVMLRSVPEDKTLARMIVRGRKKNDIPSDLEVRLDSDNGYRDGAGGDIDGDGREEIVLIRDNKILIFFEAERSARTSSYALSTNRRSVAIGDLDAKGFVSGPQFGSDKGRVDVTLEAGGTTKREVVNLTNTAGTEPIPYTASVVNNPSWLTVSAASNQTPVTLLLDFNTTGLAAGDYSTQVEIRSSNTSVVNQPYKIDVALKVTAALLAVTPASLTFSYPCTGTTTIANQSFTINGTAGLRYTAAILESPEVVAARSMLTGTIYNAYMADEKTLILRDEAGNEAPIDLSAEILASSTQGDWPSGVPWLSASSRNFTIPDTITLSATRVPTGTTPSQDALVVIVADSRAGAPPGNVRIVDVSIFCASTTIHLPIIGR